MGVFPDQRPAQMRGYPLMRFKAYYPNERQFLHRHPQTRLIVILNGAFREDGIGAAGEFENGDIIIRPAFVCHGDIASTEGASYLQFSEAPGFLNRRCIGRVRRVLRGRMDLSDPSVRRALRSKNASSYIAEQTLFAAYAQFDDDCGFCGAAARLATDAVLNIANLAAEFDMRPDRFSKRFRSKFGLSPRAYANEARLERALELLAMGSGSSAEIAASCGYFDQSHMAKAVRRAMNMTPLEFHRLSGA